MDLSDFLTPCIADVRPLAFPARPAAPSSAGGMGISWFSRAEVLHVWRVFDRAGPSVRSRYRAGTMLPSASLNGVGARDSLFSRLNTAPVHAPVNASRAALRPTAHDS